MWLEDKDVLVLAKKNKQDPTQVQFPGDWLVMVSSVIGAPVDLFNTFNIHADIYIHEQLMLDASPLRV